MGVIKSVLREELGSSLKMLEILKKEVKRHKGGSFIKKSINGHQYYYLTYRDGIKVRFIYKGKKLSEKEKKGLENSRKKRAQYKQNISKLNRRVKYLRRVLNGKEDV